MPLISPTPPLHIACRLPPLALLKDTLLSHIATIEAGSVFVRAAWNNASILPARVERTYRFGPPPAWRSADGGFPFHWIYASDNVFTSAWEAGLCANDAEQPGTFYIERGARTALIATLAFKAPLKLLDLNGLASSKLGIFDEISSCDHSWCQWFGCMLDQVIAEQDGRLHGMLYPSRKHRGHDAAAISSRALAALVPLAAISVQPFGGTSACQALQTDRCCVPPP